MSNSLQGVYSPLPQNLSDSDSEKELSMDPVCGGNYGNSRMKNFESNSFRQNGHMNFDNISEDVIKIKRGSPNMSTLRKTAFVSSILLCFVPIVIFIWVLPCSDSETCPVKISNWEYQQEDIEMKGKINLVHGLFKNNLNLAVLYEGSLNLENNKDHARDGAISFLGSNGAVAWDFRQETIPIDMDCSIIDIDGNGWNDCLILDVYGIKAIETISGVVIWRVKSPESDVEINDLSTPVKLKDFDGDGVTEFLTVYQKRHFFIVSGKTGKTLSSVKVNCNNITNLGLKDQMVTYSCENNNIVKYYEIPVDTFLLKFRKPENNLKPTKVIGGFKEKVYSTGNRKLIITNNGECPKCHSTVSLFDDKEKPIKTWAYNRSYIMNPKAFSFQVTPENIKSLKGHVNGFILKLWQWPENSKKLQFKKTKRNIPINNDTYYNEIMEKTILITFNQTDHHVINASLTDVNQLCFKFEGNTKCQPDYKNQEDSLLIDDLDKDNSQELISYSSTYVRKEDEVNGATWHLVSHLKVFRLEGELPKLYQANWTE